MPLFLVTKPKFETFASSAVAASHTGDLVETTLATITIPANTFGANGVVRLSSLWTYTNSANNKIIRTRLGGVLVASNTMTTSATVPHNLLISNRNSTSSQVTGPPTGGMAVSSVAYTTSARDTTASQDLTLNALLALAGETITLEEYLVEIMYKA